MANPQSPGRVEATPANDDTTTRRARALMAICIGSTAAEIGAHVAVRQLGGARTVPHCVVYLDTTPYETLSDRLLGTGFGRRELDRVMPREHFFELKDPIGGGLSLDDDINADWRRLLFEPILILQATRVGHAPGANGTPALGH